jgi:ubiquinone/menaquinone biosynthesis C-methylase UbiE
MPEAIARRQYDQMAGFYDRLWRGYVTRTLAFLKGWARITPVEAVLDVACGTGVFARMLLADNPAQRVAGVDISAPMLQCAAGKCGRYASFTLQQARVQALPYASCSFDVVISANAFHYFDEPLAVLAEMRRVLKPGGQLTILDWCRDFPVCAACDVVLSVLDPAHKQCYTRREFHALLAEAGFAIHRARRVRFGAVWGLMVATASP